MVVDLGQLVIFQLVVGLAEPGNVPKGKHPEARREAGRSRLSVYA